MAVYMYRTDYSGKENTIRILNWRNLLRVDWMLSLCVLALIAVGLSTLYSATHSTNPAVFRSQLLVFLPGFIAIAALVATDHRFLVSLAPVMYGLAVTFLLLVEFFGSEAKGAERWLQLGPIRIQPSEMTKLAMVYFLTWYLTVLGERVKKWYWFGLTFILVGIPMGLIFIQPNLGTALSLGPLTVVMLFVAGARYRHLIAIGLVGLSLVPVLWLEMKDFDPLAKPYGSEVSSPEEKVNPESLIGLKDYQKKRIYSFLHPDFDPQDTGWHTYQSKITVGSGGLTGKGYLEGTQTRLNYLPEHHTDFIFSLLAEERGFIGVAVVLGFFAAFFFRALMFARDCPEMTGVLLATGVVCILFFHVFVNIAITVGLMPVTGIPLPFLSYGRSFYLTTLLCVGVLLNVPMRNRLFIRR